MKAKKSKLAVNGGVNRKKLKANLKTSKPPMKSILKKKNLDECFNSDVKKLKNTEPLFYKALQSSKDDLDLDTSFESKVEEMDGYYNIKDDKEEEEDNMEGDSNVDSDEESDDDEEDEDKDSEEEDEPSEMGGVITSTVIKKWENEMSDKRSAIAGFKHAQHALSAALQSIDKKQKEKKSQGLYVLKGSKLFNSVVRMCLKSVPSALYKMFDVKCLSDRPVKNKKWKKISGTMKNYLKDFITLIASISEPSALVALLKKGVLALLPFYAEFPALSWRLTRHMATLWCTSHEKVRVLALVALFRLLRSFGEDRKDKALKLLYISYVSNCRFTSPPTWPVIHFMRGSLAELYSMDQALAYRHSFVYIRQLAVHLRNAMLMQKKERLQLVYNWQFVHCLHLWADLLARTHPSAILQPMIYPLTQIAIGIMKLHDSPRYFPLTFHICDILAELSSKTHTFIPVLPHLLEILTTNHLFKKPKKNSLKPLQWDCIIKVTESQMNESAFPEGLVDKVFDCTLRYLNTQCNSIAFPELVIPMKIEIQSFKKKCKSTDMTKKMNQLLDKVKENAEFIDNLRKNVSFNITDTKAIKNWEIEVEQSTPPLGKFYLQWKTMKEELNQRETATELTTNEKDELSISAVRKRQAEENGAFGDVDDVKEEEEEKQEPAPKKQKQDSKMQSTKPTTSSKKSKLEKEENDESGEDDFVTEMHLSDYESDASYEDAYIYHNKNKKKAVKEDSKKDEYDGEVDDDDDDDDEDDDDEDNDDDDEDDDDDDDGDES